MFYEDVYSIDGRSHLLCFMKMFIVLIVGHMYFGPKGDWGIEIWSLGLLPTGSKTLGAKIHMTYYQYYKHLHKTQ